MKICVIGTGYVGLVAGTCLADMGNDVICVDNDLKKLEMLEKGIVPIYEPGLEELIKANVMEGRLTFSSNLAEAVQKSLVCFIAVGTPQSEDGSADMHFVMDVAESIGKAINGYKVIVDKSTVPVGTADKVKAAIEKYYDGEFDVVSNPEFLKQGAAVDDFLKPDRVVIGSNSPRATAIMQEIGLNVDIAEDGTDAVDIMSSAEGRKYDLIFMDIQMPKMDGYTATREIRTLNDPKCANIPIIAMTANAFEEDRKKAIKAGMNGHIAKPISVDVILENLDQIFKR